MLRHNVLNSNYSNRNCKIKKILSFREDKIFIFRGYFLKFTVTTVSVICILSCITIGKSMFYNVKTRFFTVMLFLVSLSYDAAVCKSLIGFLTCRLFGGFYGKIHCSFLRE